MGIGNIDTWRKGHMAVAEWVDAWRIVPRALVMGYAYMLWIVVQWYMNLKPEILEGCNVELLKEVCVIQAPTTAHSIVLSAVVGVAAAVFGLYSNSGRSWNGFTNWGNGEKPGSGPTYEEGKGKTE